MKKGILLPAVAVLAACATPAPVSDHPKATARDLEQVTSIVATHQIRDAFYIATHKAIRSEGGVRIVSGDESLAERAEFMVLHDGRIHFEGTAAELLSSQDPYLQHFLHMTLPPW